MHAEHSAIIVNVLVYPLGNKNKVVGRFEGR